MSYCFPVSKAAARRRSLVCGSSIALISRWRARASFGHDQRVALVPQHRAVRQRRSPRSPSPSRGLRTPSAGAFHRDGNTLMSNADTTRGVLRKSREDESIAEANARLLFRAREAAPPHYEEAHPAARSTRDERHRRGCPSSRAAGSPCRSPRRSARCPVPRAAWTSSADRARLKSLERHAGNTTLTLRGGIFLARITKSAVLCDTAMAMSVGNSSAVSAAFWNHGVSVRLACSCRIVGSRRGGPAIRPNVVAPYPWRCRTSICLRSITFSSAGRLRDRTSTCGDR